MKNQTMVFEGYDQLSEKEKDVFENLCAVDNESLWGLAIKNVCEKPDVVKFRRLICQLKSQNADCSEVMKKILGPAYEAVTSL